MSFLIDTIRPGGLRDNTLFERSVDVAASIDRNCRGEDRTLNNAMKQEIRDSISRCMINSRFSDKIYS